MPRPFLDLTLDQFTELVARFPWNRTINEVHLHHTFRPNHADFHSRPPGQSIEGMFRFHTETRGFSDIAQHVTIDPNGTIWTGRNFNNPPASATGFNGNESTGPFMIEMIGNFDTNRDRWEGAQRDVAVAVMALIQRTHGLGPEAFRLHHEMNPKKSCPGTSLPREELLKAVQAAHALGPVARAARQGAFDERASVERANAERLLRLFDVDSRSRGPVAADTELPEHLMTLGDGAMSAGEPGAFTTARSASRDLTSEDREFLRRHVINLRMGALSSGGLFQTSPEDVQALFAEHLPRFLDERRKEGNPLRLVFFAHGGLNEEDESLKNARNRIDFYLQNKCYPVFFVWETGVKETLVDILREIIGLGPAREISRGIIDTISDFTDPGLERAFRNGGFAMWANMKRSAELGFLPKQGGALVVAELVEFWKAHSAEMSIHAIGHSAGTIFHAHFLQALCEQPSNPPVEVASVHFLAPAITVDLFKDTLMPLVGSRVKTLTEFTMHREFEQADAVGPYRKSLLYLVSRSFEDSDKMPILGLEESIRQDPDLMDFFGLRGSKKKQKAEILFSALEEGPSHSTIAKKHGDFDNDRLTMSGVIRRILAIGDDVPIVEFPETVSRTVFDAPAALTPVRPLAAAGGAAPAAVATPQGRRRALCVGIDAYDPPNRLAGCVNDANDWSNTLRGQGFDVTLMTDGGATWKGVCDALTSLVATSRAGDTIVFQYAGHGSLVDDLDGDERGGKDSALCPVDFPAGGFIIDDDVRRIFGNLPDGVALTCFFDCCHSGTITRLVAPSRDAMMRGDVRVRGLQATPEMEDAHRRFREGLRLAAPAGRGPDTMREVSFTACSDAQTAQEINGHGQFTVRALSILRQGVTGLTNGDFHTRVLAAFGAGAAAQTPQLDCAAAAKALPLLGSMGGAPTVIPAAGTDMSAVLSRLADIERRLTILGA